MNRIKTQFAVVGGGPAGICGALAAARSGIQTVLIHDRPVLGGNSSSEIRVWSRGAVGAGNFYSEEMGIWGELKLTNFYRNREGNPVFWDEVLLDAVLAEPNLQLLLNTEISQIAMDGNRIVSVSGDQQGTQKHFSVEADVFLDATGDANLGYLAGLPYYLGEAYIPTKDAPLPEKPELLGCSILFYTKREDHPVSFVPPNYAYGLEEISGLINRGGRVVSEKMGGSDCWWFEYGGSLDTIGRLQDITLELKRLVMGVWNYIKNSGLYDAEYYTLEWVGSVPGKRESRRMETAYILTEEDIRTGKQFPDGAFYGGWYMDTHPAGGMHDTKEENCIQIPVNVYQIPLRCLYQNRVPNLLFAGRNIGTQRQAFVSSRVMNTCALAGQAAGELACAMLRTGKDPGQLEQTEIRKIQLALMRGDMFIPGADIADPEDLSNLSKPAASSSHPGGWGNPQGKMPVLEGTFLTFPGLEGKRVKLLVEGDHACVLQGTWHISSLPNRFCFGQEAGAWREEIVQGRNELILPVPPGGGNRFCTLALDACDAVSILCAKPEREGFLCGRRDSPVYREPMLAYQEETPLYQPERVAEYPNRPWNAPNQWKAAREDRSPWLELHWQHPQTVRQIRLFLDPSLNEELPSSRAKYWQESHHFVPRTAMPPALIRDAAVLMLEQGGSWKEIGHLHDNCQRLVVLDLPEPADTLALRLQVERTWGDAPAVYHIGVYSKNYG